MTGHRYRHGERTTATLRSRQVDRPLTPDQRTLLELLSRGRTLVDAAAYMGLSVNTTKTHARYLYARLGADNAAHAVRVGFERELLTTGPPGDELVELLAGDVPVVTGRDSLPDDDDDDETEP